ncbi:MAG: hypothetical protein LBC35_08385 [Coriobacteriales bacterium]|nr:hypothetical protein [Coriobacteriales bacterium]
MTTSQAAPQAAPSAKPKSKRPLVIALAVVLVVALGVGGFFGITELMRSGTYDDAVRLMSDKDYSSALVKFNELGDYRDAQQKATTAQNYIDYEAAKARFDSGDLEGALTEFTRLSSAGFIDSSDWVKQVKYALAEKKLAAGDNFGAYYDFASLGSYSDAVARAEASKIPFPASGIIWQDPAFFSVDCGIKFDYRFSSGGSFYKIYAGSQLIATVFMNGISEVMVEVPPGDYIIKEGTGDLWWGPELAFGEKGYYSTMTFDDYGTDYVNLAYNELVTITIGSAGAGNISERDEDLSSF